LNVDWQIIPLLEEAVRSKASDLHLSVGVPPIIRLHGELMPLDYPALVPEDTAVLAGQIMNKKQEEEFKEKGELDLAYSCPGLGRFRVNIYRQRGSIAIALRVLNTEIPTLSSLNLPAVIKDFTLYHKGLLLVTGPTGSGKSTTLASFIDLINQERSCHIITLEDPIEYLHQHKNCMINQREIGQDSGSFAEALRAALRQDPDVILVGEMRDLETISIAITAAETGHLVLATLHTVDAVQTIDRVIDVFPPHQQQQIRIQLANTLIGVIAQRLLRRKDGAGRVPAVEILVSNPAVRNLIREGKIHQIYSVIQTGGRQGMQLMDSYLEELYRRGIIDRQTAIENATDPENLSKNIGRGPLEGGEAAAGLTGFLSATASIGIKENRKLPTFRYVAKNMEGETSRHSQRTGAAPGRRAAARAGSLCHQHQGAGRRAAAPGGPWSGSARFKGEKKPKSRDFMVFCRQFATMLQAGITVLQILKIQAQQAETPLEREAARGGARRGAGRRPGWRHGKHGDFFPRIIVSMVEAGEAGGILDTVMNRLAEHFQNQHDLEEKIRSATMYPLIVTGAGRGGDGVMVFFVLPRFRRYLKIWASKCPFHQGHLALSRFVTGYWYLILALLLLLVLALRRYLRAPRRGGSASTGSGCVCRFTAKFTAP
jgi:twitching motility protein PilT